MAIVKSNKGFSFIMKIKTIHKIKDRNQTKKKKRFRLDSSSKPLNYILKTKRHFCLLKITK